MGYGGLLRCLFLLGEVCAKNACEFDIGGKEKQKSDLEATMTPSNRSPSSDMSSNVSSSVRLSLYFLSSPSRLRG